MGRVMLGRRRLGLGIGRDRVSAVLLARNGVRWAAYRTRCQDISLADTLTPLLAECPRHRFRPITVIAAVGPSVSQLKCLTELPPVRDVKAIDALVRSNVGRFFLRNGVPLRTSTVLVESPDRVWVAAVDAPVVVDIASACRRAGLSLQMVVPSAVAFRRAIRGKSISWNDGDVRLDICYGENAPAIVRRLPGSDDSPDMPALVDMLAGLRDTAPHTIDAGAAALTQRGESIAIRCRDDMRGDLNRRRVIRATVACCAAVVLAVTSPGITAAIAQRRAGVREARIEQRARTARSEENELAQVTASLRTLTEFQNSRRSMTAFLARVARSLPDSAAIVGLQVDSTGSGSIVAIAQNAASVVDAVERTPGLASPQIIGPVTRERIGGRTIERVTVRFQLLQEGLQ